MSYSGLRDEARRTPLSKDAIPQIGIRETEKVNSRPNHGHAPRTARKAACKRACMGDLVEPDLVTVVAYHAMRRLMPGVAHDARIAVSAHASESTTAVESRRLLIGATDGGTTTREPSIELESLLHVCRYVMRGQVRQDLEEELDGDLLQL